MSVCGEEDGGGVIGTVGDATGDDAGVGGGGISDSGGGGGGASAMRAFPTLPPVVLPLPLLITSMCATLAAPSTQPSSSLAPPSSVSSCALRLGREDGVPVMDLSSAPSERVLHAVCVCVEESVEGSSDAWV